jgi:two-component system OmpR family sensor kinase
MLARLEAADADRRRDAERLRRFVDDASHELRTPITAIAGYAELYQAGGVAPGAPLERAMARISEASERATRLVEDLLALARLEREIGSRSEDTDLEPLVLALAEDTRVTTGREVWADTAGPVVLHADPLWLRQALDNLVHNALTHAPEDRPVTVVLRHDDREAVVTVVDHGPGVGADDRDRVFERFARLDGESGRPARGTGLGLSIVREIVDAHEGRVEVVDTPGGGASFTIRLPRRAPR